MSALDTKGFGTGAVVRAFDARDWALERSPKVAAALAAPIPDVVDHSRWCRVYNQGPLPSCVAHSIAGEQTAYEAMNEHETVLFDAPAVYRDCGGDGVHGIPTARCLKYAVDQGLPAVGYKDGAPYRRKLASYAYTTDVATICAALAVGSLCVFAWMLPTDFWQGDCGVGPATSSYHQTVAVGYDRPKGRLKFLNSWGVGYGHSGFGTVPFTYLKENLNQYGRFYAYSTADLIEKPVPTPIPEPLPSDEALLRNSFDLLGVGVFSTFSKTKVDTLRDQLKRRLKI